LKIWQREVIETIKDGLRKGKVEDDILCELGGKNYNLSARQWDFYLRKAKKERRKGN